MTARPYLPKHFPGHAVYLWIDADAWVQDDTVLDIFVSGARRGMLAVVPEVDRGYWTIHKRPNSGARTSAPLRGPTAGAPAIGWAGMRS